MPIFCKVEANLESRQAGPASKRGRNTQRMLREMWDTTLRLWEPPSREQERESAEQPQTTDIREENRLVRVVPALDQRNETWSDQLSPQEG